ncbi:MAG: hypothetical protein H6R10_1309 [Rhodocyclaceae bacterium]|nr:hypothetical protein [Rhodocyclaceae bacterium]
MSESKQAQSQGEAMGDVDQAARIFVAHTVKAMEEMRDKRIDYAAAIQVVMQMSMRSYADFVGDDGDAIRQIRGFLDQWERDLSNPPSVQ